MITITIQGPNQNQQFGEIAVPCTIGRLADDMYPKLQIDDPFVSRQHVQLSELNDRHISIRCIGRSAVTLSTRLRVEPQTEVRVTLPVEIFVGRSSLLIESVDLSVSILRSPRRHDEDELPLMTQMIKSRSAQDITTEQLIEWFDSLISLQENAIGPQAFYRRAAQAVVDMIGLDHCIVLTRQDDDWTVEAEYGEQNEASYSRSVLDRVVDIQKTVYEETIDLASARSLVGFSAFVGSPFFSTDGTIAGCLFGSRRTDGESGSDGVNPIQAHLVQVVAGIVGSRLARLDAEAEQTRAKVQLEQFASPALVREMQDNPHWLDAQQRELTMLFGDIRGFSRLGVVLSAADMYSFVRDTMDCLTNAILEHGGFVFNYAGDGIAAMWNAPGLSSSHAVDACKAALALQNSLRDLDQVWSKRIMGPVRVGVGIHTGTAFVGNSGSKARLHYSPLGNAVNLASRLEGATKHFGVRTLISEATKQLIGDEFESRNLGEIIVVGIDQPIGVYELGDGSVQRDKWRAYDALRYLFEQGDRVAAATKAKSNLSTYGDDGPTNALLKRINDYGLGDGSVWKLDGK